METIINQHFVPQCHLKYWCDSDKQLHVLKKDTLYRRKRSRKSSATRKHTYDTQLTLNKDEPELYQFFEKSFRDIENEGAKVFENIAKTARKANTSIVIPTEILRVSNDDTDRLARLTVVQMLRDMRFRDTVRDRLNSWMRSAWEITVPRLFSPEDEPGVLFEGVNEDYVKHYHMQFLEERLDKFSDVLRKRIVVIGFNKWDRKLFTSDSPVNCTGFYIHAGLKWDGISSATSRVAYPIAPDICAIFYDREYYVSQYAYHQHVRLLSLSEVENLNKHLFLQADKEIFSCDGDFEHAFQTVYQQRIEGRWPKGNLEPIPDHLVEMLIGYYRLKKHTKSEWKSFLQMEDQLPVKNAVSSKDQTYLDQLVAALKANDAL